MKRALIVDAFSGAAGDMLLAALIDAGAPLEALRRDLLSIPALANVKVDVETVRRGAFAANRLLVGLPHEHVHRHLHQVVEIIDSASTLGDGVKARARNAFEKLAAAEAKVHGMTVEKVHFHEVGALDAILDIVGFFACAESLGIDAFYYTTLAVGMGGVVEGEHGKMPVPAPATLEILAGHRITYTDRREELLTPTAAAIIAAAFQPLPPDAYLVPSRVGYGAGTREGGALPNVVRVSIGEMETSRAHDMAVVRCTIDDMNPELYGQLMQGLFVAGAREVFYTPVIMKKNRPGVEVTVIAEIVDTERITDHLFVHSTTLGIRVAHEARVELERRQETVETPLGPARVKVAVLPDGTERMSPEYESCREIAERTHRTLLDVFDEVRRAWTGSRRRTG